MCSCDFRNPSRMSHHGDPPTSFPFKSIYLWRKRPNFFCNHDYVKNMGPIFTALGGKTDCSVFDSIEWFVGGKWSNTSLDSSPSFSLSQLFWNMLLAPNSDLYKNNKLYHFKHDISYLWTDIHDIHELYSVEYRSKMFLQMITFCFIQVYTASQLFSESGCINISHDTILSATFTAAKPAPTSPPPSPSLRSG